MSLDLVKTFRLDVSALELIFRTSLVYLALLTGLRMIIRREMGTFGLPDLLTVVLIADGVQNGMSGEYTSVTGALIVAGTLIGWNYVLDLLTYHVRFIHRLLAPSPVPLVEDGRMMRRNMRREMVTVDELCQHLRTQGIDDVRAVKRAVLEADGEISVIRFGDGERAPEDKRPAARLA